MSFPIVLDKDPDEIIDYVVDWSNQMTLDTDTIATSDWVLDDGITEDSASNTTTQTLIFISGGTAGQRYDVTNRITTVGGRTWDQSFTVKVAQR